MKWQKYISLSLSHYLSFFLFLTISAFISNPTICTSFFTSSRHVITGHRVTAIRTTVVFTHDSKEPCWTLYQERTILFSKQELFLIKVESTKNILSNVCIFVTCVIVHIKINIFSMYAWRHCKYCFKKKHNPLTFIAYRPGPSWCTPIRATSVNVIARTVSITVPTCEFAFLPISPICTSWKKHAAVISYI